ncbi:hypothetical protein, partial [Salmonella enterica]|uniref:hypothetical protein n=1 Tax=Salmonella enterica TaxID=28901 RepID=UPI00398C76E5
MVMLWMAGGGSLRGGSVGVLAGLQVLKVAVFGEEIDIEGLGRGEAHEVKSLRYVLDGVGSVKVPGLHGDFSVK